MQNSTIEALEERINKVISLVRKLKVENATLQKKNQELVQALEDKEKMINSLQNESERVKGMQSEIRDYREKQDHIRVRVDSLLEKLKEFESIE